MISSLKSLLLGTTNRSLKKCLQTGCTVLKLLGTAHRRGWQSRMPDIVHQPCSPIYELGCFEMQPKMGGKHLLKLNIGTRPILNKYCQGKMKSTLKWKLMVRETVWREAHGISNALLRFRQFCLVTCTVRIRVDRLWMSFDQNCHIPQQCVSTAVGAEW